MSDDLFGSLFDAGDLAERTDDRAWLQALLDVEAALARASARVGLVPKRTAEEITRCAVADRFDAADIGRRAVGPANPVVPLVADLVAAVPPDVAGSVHAGATSQDILDTAMCLVAARASEVILADLADAAEAVAGLAATHRRTLQLGRTLLQQAAPTTFGLVCAGWLSALDEARAALLRVRRYRLAVQFGGAVGTLAALGEHGVLVGQALADELRLPLPAVPWHTNRCRIAELAAALGVVAGVLGGVALDVMLLAQTEIAEVAEDSPGGSSTLPGKRNPSRAALVTACTHQVPGLVATVLAGQPQELQRSPGRWHAEWPTVTGLLRLVGSAAAHHRRLVGGLRVDADRMRENLRAAGGAVLAESVATALARGLGRPEANALVGAAARRAARTGVDLGEVLRLDPAVTGCLSESELTAALRPQDYLGVADVLVDRALARHDDLVAAERDGREPQP